MDPEKHIVQKLERQVSSLDRECGNLAQMIVDREFSMHAAIDVLEADNDRTDDERRKLAVRVLESGMRPNVETHPLEA